MAQPVPEDLAGPAATESWSSWERARSDIEQAVAESKTIAREVRAGTDFSALDTATNSLGDSTFRIGAIGEFSTGKSTLINAMLADELLPVGVLPKTARLAEIRHGAFPKIIIETLTGDRQKITREEFVRRNEQLKAAEDKDEPADPEADYVTATFEVSSGIVGAGVAYVDVPGHHSGFLAHEAIADEAMKSCDALIAVLHADAVLRSVESDRLGYALVELQHRSVFVAINKMGLLREEQQEELLSGFAPRWERFLDSLDLPVDVADAMRRRVYFVDAFNTLRHRLGRGDDYTGVAEFGRLEQDLAALADGDLIARKLSRPKKILLRRLGDLRKTVADQNKLLDVDAADLATKKDQVHASVTRLDSLATGIEDLIDRNGIRQSGENTVRELAKDHFTWCLDKLPDWARDARTRREPAKGNRVTRLLPARTRDRIKTIAAELTERLGRETVRWGEREVFPAVVGQLRAASELVQPGLRKFEQEINNTWRELLLGTGTTPPTVDVASLATEELLDLRPEELPLDLQPAGVVRLVLRDVGLRILQIILEIARTERSGVRPGELVAAAWRIATEIESGVRQLRETVIGSETDTREALDALLEKFACRIVDVAMTSGQGGRTALANRYAANAGGIIKNRLDKLRAYLREQGARVDSLYQNTVATVNGGLAQIEAERAKLAHAEERLTAMVGTLEDGMVEDGR